MSSEFGEAAAELAHAIVKSAVWFDGRCNWTGALPKDEPDGANAALGPDLYGGSSGVALFLAEAGARLDDDRLRATALGAIRHALDHAGGIHPDHRDGLYLGPVGVAYAAERVAELLTAEEPLERARGLLAAWRRNGTRTASADVMSGSAGAVAGLLALNDRLDDAWLVEAAASRAEEVIAKAERGPAGWSWAQPGRRSLHNPCGFAHGAAGIGHALAEVFAVTGDARFRDAALCAFAYERSWFDSRSRTWADLRDVGRRARRDAPMPAADSWCNGAPGIALSRLRSAALLGSAAVDRDAAAAVAACERHVAGLLTHAPGDFSLCHGAAGAGDVLLYAADRRGDRLARLAAEVGLRGIELHHRPGARSFPCGTPRGETPALMLGFAGIGMFYLRLLDPGVATPLLVRRRARVDSRVGGSIQSQVPRPRRDQ
jgi:lantibiotic biosynthesis protein